MNPARTKYAGGTSLPGVTVLLRGHGEGATGVATPGRRFAGVLEILSAFAVAALVIAPFSAIVLRDLFDISLPWEMEFSELPLATVAFVGGAAAYQAGYFVALTAVVARFPPRVKAAIDAFGVIVAIVLCGLVSVYGAADVVSQWPLATRILQWPQGALLVPLPLGAAGIMIFAALRLLRMQAVDVFAGTSVLAVIGCLLGLASLGPTQEFWWTAGTTMALLVLLLVLAVPVAFALLGASVGYLAATGASPISGISGHMEDGIGSFLLLAIPCFLFAGLLLVRTGLSRRLFDAAYAAFRRVPGGVQYTTVIAMYLFSGVSGSKLADIAAVGSVAREDMARLGYRRGELAALLSSSAVMGEAIPPSIPLLVLGSSVPGLSVKALFIAGLLPAALLAVCIMAVIFVRARGTKTTLEHRTPRQVRGDILRGIPPLIVPGVLLVGIGGGFATPSEISAVAAMLAIIIWLFGRRPSLAVLWSSLRETVALSGMVLFLIGCAHVLSWVLTVSQIADRLQQVLTSGSGAKSFLVLSVLVLPMVGLVLEGLPAVIIFGPLLLPVAMNFGVDQVQYGILFVVATGLGAFLPPFGIGIAGAAAITHSTIEEASRPMLVYSAVLIVGMLVIAFVPAVSLALLWLLT